MNFRRANPAICQSNGWGTSNEECGNYVDQYNAQRMIAGGWIDFIVLDSPDYAIPDEIQKKTLHSPWRRNAAAVLNSGKAALSAYASMFGSVGPVSKDLAEKRAAVCVVCPLNGKRGGLKNYFVEAAAHEIMALLSALKDMDLTTSAGDKLGVCDACSCPMGAKVFVNIEKIKSNLDPAQMAALDPKCWITSELKP